MWIHEPSEEDQSEESQGDFEALEIDKDEDLIAFGYFAQIKNQKDHFYHMQFLYRSLASTWLLFFFAGAGFILSKHSGINLPINTLLAVSVLDILTVMAILLIWHIDIILYQKLWIACVIELTILEKNHTWLTQSNSNILRITAHNQFKFFQSYYYIAFILILSSILTCSGGFYIYYLIGKTASIITIIFGVIVSILIPGLMIYFGKETKKYDEKSFTSSNEKKII